MQSFQGLGVIPKKYTQAGAGADNQGVECCSPQGPGRLGSRGRCPLLPPQTQQALAAGCPQPAYTSRLGKQEIRNPQTASPLTVGGGGLGKIFFHLETQIPLRENLILLDLKIMGVILLETVEFADTSSASEGRASYREQGCPILRNRGYCYLHYKGFSHLREVSLYSFYN